MRTLRACLGSIAALLAGCELNRGAVGTLAIENTRIERLRLHGADGEATELPAAFEVSASRSPLRLEAELSGPTPGSLSFVLDGERIAVDDAPPYALTGWSPNEGIYRVRATVHALPGGSGKAGAFLEATLVVTPAPQPWTSPVLQPSSTGPNNVPIISPLTTPSLPPPPSSPASLSATASACTQVDLSWQPSAGGVSPLSYKVYRDDQLIKQVAASPTTDTTLSGATSYQYEVSAVDALDRESPRSSSATVTTPACADQTAPSVPSALNATASSCSQIGLTWQASTDSGGSGLRGYNLYRGGAFLKQVLAPATSTTDSGLSASTSYSYRLSAIDNASNESSQSTAATASTPACPGPALLGAISVRTINVGGTIASNVDYEYGPFLAMLPDGRAKLAWTDSTARKVYVRHLNATLSASERADTVLDGYKLYGLAAHADGRVAVLPVTPAPGSCTPCTASTSCVSCDELHLVQLASDGTIAQQRVIDDRLAHSGSFAGGSIAIGTYGGADAYAVMRTVRGAGPSSSASAFCASSAGNSGHQWHETWLYSASTLATLTSGCNVFPCGHSLFRRSAASLPGVSGFGSICMSDYTGTRTGFNYAENSGWNNRLYNVWSDWPNFANGGNPSELVPATSGSYLAALSAPQSCASNCSGDDHDLAVMEISQSTKAVVGPIRWIATQPGWEKFPHLANYGSSFLVGWVTNDTPGSDFTVGTHFWLAEINSSGTILSGPEEITSAASFTYGSTWAAAANGDVLWPRRASSTTIEVVRVAR